MRKIFVAIITLALAIVMSLSSLLGCKLITTNNERDMNQVVATVQIDTSAPKKTIYKKDMLVKYLGYVYGGQTSSTSNAELFSDIIDELINNAVMVQYAMDYNAKSGTFANVNDNNKWKVETYLSDEDKIDARYNSYLEIDNLIAEHLTNYEEEKKGDTLNDTIRVVPTGAKNDVELDSTKKTDLIEKFNEKLNKEAVDFDIDRYNAYIKALNKLKANDLLGNYENNDIETTDYFKEILTNYQEEILLENFQEDFESKARKTIDYSDLQAKYNQTYTTQRGYTTSEFESALSSMTADKPILKGKAGYGMVYHVLLKADEDTTAKLEELKEDYKIESGSSAYENAKYSADRAELFADITAKDQRSTWIKAGYDFDGTYFTGDYTLCENAPIQFYGSTTHINGADDNEDGYRAKYRVNSVSEMSLQEFLTLVNDYLYNGTANIGNITDPIDSRTFTATTVNADYDKRVKELMFAFSQDDSDTALNTFKGYAIKPTPDGTEEEEWMLEFAEEGRDLIKKDQKTFKVVATDYGYHIMFFSENFANVDLPTLEDYLNYNYGTKDWQAEYNAMIENWYDYEDTKNLLYVLQNTLSTTFVNNEYSALRNEILSEIVYNSEKVVKNVDAYRDLLED